MKTTAPVPPSPPDPHENAIKAGLWPPAPIFHELTDLGRQRVFAIKMQSVCDRSCDSYVAHYLGYHSAMPEAEGKALFKRVAAIRKGVEKQWKADQKTKGHETRENQDCAALGGDDGEGHFSIESSHALYYPIILGSIISRQYWDGLRNAVEPKMCDLARSLPVWSRCAEVAGFAELGLAVILAEAGNDLAAYPHPEHLWKRLGLAPYKGKAMSRYHGKTGPDGLTDEEWTEQGYNKRRLARIVGVVGTPLWLHKSGNNYGAVYAARREHTALTHPDWTKGHSDNDAQRIMLKRFIADLWRWWRECSNAVGVRDAAAA